MANGKQDKIEKEPEWFEDERTIKYRTLNELKKLEEFKDKAEKRDSINDVKMRKQDSIIKSQESLIDFYEKEAIPNYISQIELYEAKDESRVELQAIRDEKWELKYANLKSKRLGFGLYFGYGATIQGLQPSVGISLNYTIIRF